MNIATIPGYLELFNESLPDYEEVVANIPSHYIISFAILFSSELNIIGIKENTQQKLFSIITRSFDDAKFGRLVLAYNSYKNRDHFYKGDVFSKRHLIELILRETKRNYGNDIINTDSSHDYNMFIAYLIVVSEYNQKQEYDALMSRKVDNESFYPQLWVTFINQFEFTERSELPFEYYKIFSFVKYLQSNYFDYLKTYVLNNGFKNIDEYLGSINSITEVVEQTNDEYILKQSKKIIPHDSFTRDILNNISINQKCGENISISDLKKLPVYKSNDDKYLIIDKQLYYRSIYRRLFFDFYEKTAQDVNHKLGSRPNYISNIASNVLEKICFRNIVKALCRKHDFLYFDDNSKQLIDAYIRIGNKIILIEFKGYLFPDKYLEVVDKGAIKNYIDSRLVRNEDGKLKGVSQLVKSIKDLLGGLYNFDVELVKLKDKRIEIYPVICHNDFYFSLTGVPEYLNEIFSNEINDYKKNSKIGIKEISVLNLETLFSLAVFGLNINDLLPSLDSYSRYKASKLKQARKASHNFEKATKLFQSFRDINFYCLVNIVKRDLIKNKKIKNYTDIMTFAGIDTEIISERYDV